MKDLVSLNQIKINKIEAAKAVISILENGTKKFKNPSPRIRIIQKIYNSLMNPGSEIVYPKVNIKNLLKMWCLEP